MAANSRRRTPALTISSPGARYRHLSRIPREAPNSERPKHQSGEMEVAPGDCGLRGSSIGRVNCVALIVSRQKAPPAGVVANCWRRRQKGRALPRKIGAAGFRRLVGFRGIYRNSAKTGITWRGGAKYATRLIRRRLRRIFRESRDFRRISETSTWGPARRVCAF